MGLLPFWVDTLCLTILLAGKVVAIATAASIVETGTAAALTVKEEPVASRLESRLSAATPIQEGETFQRNLPWHTTPTRPHFFLLVARVDLSQGGGHPHSLHGVSWLPKHILVV